jgi:hypothetical protein
VVGSRLLPLALAAVALSSGAVGLDGIALWVELLAVPAAAAAAFVAASDALEGRPARLQAVTSALALALLVVGSAARANAVTGGAAPHLATWALLAALVAYAVPAVAWVLQPVRLPRSTRPPRRRLRPAEVEELLSRAA